MLTHVEFSSPAFPAYDDERELVNPGRHGKRLGEFLAKALQDKGESVGTLFSEDWGWILPIEDAGFKLWIGIGNYGKYPEGFLCFIEPHTEYVRKLWTKIRTVERIEKLKNEMNEALTNCPDITGIKWSSYEEFHRSGT